MTWNLWLDDERDPAYFLRKVNGEVRERLFRQYARFSSDDFVWCKSSLEAQEMIEKRGLPIFMALDHDLGYTDTGMSFLRWLNRTYPDLTPPQWGCHSANPCGIQAMNAFLDSWQRSLNL